MAQRIKLADLPIEEAQPDDTVAALRAGNVVRVRVAPGGEEGTVTSVGVSMPAGFEVANSPITTNGTITITFADGYGLPTTVAMGEWSTAFGWGDHAQAGYALASSVATALGGKVDKITGKGLSTEDYTTAEKSKLTGIEAGAQVNTVTSVAGKTGAVTLAKGDVGLGNVDNTSDADKPISTAVSAALSGKVDTSDARLTNSREWTASTVGQAEAEAGTATTRRAWTSQRVRQNVAAFTYDKATIIAMVTDDANKNFTWLATTTTLTANAANAVNFSSPRTLTLPGTPAENEYVIILRTAGSMLGSTIARNGQTIMGVAENMTIDSNISYLRLDFVNGSWRIAS